MTQSHVRSSAAVALAITLSGFHPAGAQSSCAPVGVSVSSADRAWKGPLARPVTLYGRDISLREALDRLSAAARMRISYSAELLPLSRPVCLNYAQQLAGVVLEDLLYGTSLAPVSAGGDQIALSPSRIASESQGANTSPHMLATVGTLDRVVVTGSTIGGSQRGLPIALDVVTGSEMVQRGSGVLSNALDGAVPGIWLWQQSPLSLVARYGSIRGASSFGLSYPKVYIDGIEAANSLLVTQLDPDAIARVEVIRGPQGAALYGSDAISGVINIVTRQEGTEGGAPGLQLRTMAGNAASDYATGNVLEQQHSLSFRTGNGTRSGRAGLMYNTIGAFIPDAYSRTITGNAGGRLVRSNAIFTGTARLLAQDARTPPSPLLAGISTVVVSDSSDQQSVRQYTLGGTALFTTESPWTHAATVGIDGYTLKSAAVLDGAFPSAIDSALRASQGNAIRGTLRASSVVQLGDGKNQSANVIFGIEHSLVREQTSSAAPFAYSRPNAPGGQPTTEVATRSNTGLIAQFSGALNERYYVSAGVRAERNSDYTGIQNFSLLPMLGGSYVKDFGGATIKFRTAYGKGIRPPQTTIRSGSLMGLQRSFALALDNEVQSGIEFGADAFLTKNISAHVTRFDQTASGLIQPVSVAPPGWMNSGPNRRIAYQLQNVGEISNRGWELKGRLGIGPVALSGTYTNTQSLVEKIASHYSGDLRIGDRMLEVPKNTFGLDLSFSNPRIASSLRFSRAGDWINYDRIALAAAYANTAHDLREFVGAQLRTYWRTYASSSSLAGNVFLNLRLDTSLILSADNLLNEQLGGPDNTTLLPGRAVRAGLKVRF